MPSTTRQRSLGVIAAAMGLAGGAKLAGAKFTEVNFARWGYPDPARFVIGAIEVGIAGAAVAELFEPKARPVAAVGALCAMAGAFPTHVRDGAGAPEYIAPALVTAAAVGALVG